MNVRRVVTVTALVVLATAVAPVGGVGGAGTGAAVSGTGIGGHADAVAAATGTAAVANDTAGNATLVDVVVVYENASARAALVSAPGPDGERTAGVPSAVVTGGLEVDLVPMVAARMPAGATGRLAALPGVASVEREGAVTLPPGRDAGRDRTGDGSDGAVGTASVSPAGQQTPWGVTRMNATAAGTAAGGATAQADVDVAVLDTGVDVDHPDLDVTWGVETVGSDVNYTSAAYDDTNGHGTSAAGIVAALDNGEGVVGVAPAVDLYAVRVFPRNGQPGSTADLAEGIDQAVKGPDGRVGTEDDADVITMSLGGDTSDPEVEAAVREARDSGAVVVASAGNDGDGDPTTDNVSYPARYDTTVAVAATRRNESTAVFSSEGPDVEVAAPGVLVRTTNVDGTYRDFSGTSAAAPQVGGVAALLVAADGDATPGEVRAAMRDTARDVETAGVDNFSGYGRVQALRAVEALGPDPVTVADGTITPDRADNGTPTTQTVTVDVASATADGSDETVTVVLPGRASVLNASASASGAAAASVTGTDGANVTVDVATSGGGRTDYAVNVTVGLEYATGTTETLPVDAAVVDSAGERDRRQVGSTTVVNRSEVFPTGVPGVGGSAPLDPDDDSVYEDVDGDGSADFFDVVGLLFADFEAINARPEAERRALNFDGDSEAEVDFFDVVALLFDG